MVRLKQSMTSLSAMLVLSGSVWAQAIDSNRPDARVDKNNSSIKPNTALTTKPIVNANKVIRAMPLSADSQRNALKNIDRSIIRQINDLSEKLKTILPDELAILTKTNGWKTEDQQALVGALRVGDRTAVYEAWVKGNPQDIAGAELAARQTDVNRLMTRLMQDAEKNTTSLRQDAADFDTGLSKIAAATPAVADVAQQVKVLKTWIEARQLIDAATPGTGPLAKLPTGNDVRLIFDPTLTAGSAIVLNDNAMLIGQDGKSSLTITTGNAADALGLPIVTGAALPEAEGEEILSGVLLVNPASSRGTVNYSLNGTQYVAKPGMQQHLNETKNGRPWVMEFDRGESTAAAKFSLPAGTYYFTPTDQGWQLYRQRFEIVLDNAQSNQEFNFVFHGEEMIVPAGDTKTLTSNYPVVIRFDRGNGTTIVAKSTPMTVGNLQIGVNANDNMWDLFPMAGNRRESLKLQPFNADGRGSLR